jgi:hypothetical protein
MAKDKFHDNVKRALEKEGWTITAEQLRINLDVSDVEVDLMAEITFVAERVGEKIAVEVKSFLAKSFMYEFHGAMGQFMDTRAALEEKDPERVLYLAIPIDAWEHKVFQGKFIQKRLQTEKIKLIIFDQVNDIIITWIK